MKVFLEKYRIALLLTVVLLFFMCGGMVDYWQSAMEHEKYIQPYLKDYFVFFWLIFYTGILPFLMVVLASNYDRKIIRLYLGAFLWGSVLWDVIYSLNESGLLVVGIKDYLYLRGDLFGLTANQIIVWHIIRIILGWYFLRIGLPRRHRD